MQRSAARKEVFSLIFQNLEDRDEIIENIKELEEENPDSRSQIKYIKNTALGVADKKEEIDEMIKGALSAKWRIERVSKVAISALRLAVYEMMYVDDVPPKVAINEAIEITKSYSDTETAGFVNGVLGGIYKANFR